MVRVGIIDPASNMGTSADVGPALRKEWMRILTGPTLQSVRLTAVLPAQVEAEAKLKECDFILYSTFSQTGQPDTAKRAGFLKSASSMAGMLPMSGMAKGAGGMMASQVASSAINGVVEAAGAIKAKADVTLEYQLTGAGYPTNVLKNPETVKAEQDTQNVITPLIQHAAAAIASEIAKKS